MVHDSSLRERLPGTVVLDMNGSLVQDIHCLEGETTAEGRILPNLREVVPEGVHIH